MAKRSQLRESGGLEARNDRQLSGMGTPDLSDAAIRKKLQKPRLAIFWSAPDADGD